MRGMQLIRPGALSKTHDAVSSVVRKTSCSHGWLRVVVQYVFAVIIVASFILIVYMAIQNPRNNRPPSFGDSQCKVKQCRVTCAQMPVNGNYELAIVNAVAELYPVCARISLRLNKPVFMQGIMPENWLSGIRTSIHELVIAGGNLQSISSNAFMSQYSGSIKMLAFYDITMRSFADSFIGLSSLKHFYIKYSNIGNMQPGSLLAFDNTIEVLTISHSGKWNPINITGSNNFMKIDTVDFSRNYFHDILERNSFTGIMTCSVLYLNSCRISAVGLGTFDNFVNLKMLFLNNNFLMTIPNGLFHNILAIQPRPRVNLHNNSWYCDCSSEDMRKLVAEDILVIDPICHHPVNAKGMTFSKFQSYCTNNSNYEVLDTALPNADNYSKHIHLNDGCCNGNATSIFLYSRIASSEFKQSCKLRPTFGANVSKILSNSYKKSLMQAEDSWLKMTYFLQTNQYSVVEVGSKSISNRGLLWYESSYPSEVNCLNTIPIFLRLYNIELSAQYVFCPILLASREVENDKCIVYDLWVTDHSLNFYSRFRAALYISTVIMCLTFGAIVVYALIRRHPYLLKGSKRIVFVKHKTVDALVMPPNLPVRNDLFKQTQPNCKTDNVFIVPTTGYLSTNFNRQKSTRSDKSIAPSYVSAVQPTEEQLAEWRIKHHFKNDLSMATMFSELSASSWNTTGHPETTTLQYFSLDDSNEKYYESLK